MQLLLRNLSVPICSLVCDYIIFIGDAEQSLMQLLLHNQSVRMFIIVGYAMKEICETETILDAVTASQSICLNLGS